MLVLVFAVLAVGVSLAGHHFYDTNRRNIIEEKKHELAAIADLKVGQIVEWRRTRLGQAQTLGDDPLLAAVLERYLRDPAAAAPRSEILAWFEVVKRHLVYERISFFDASGAYLFGTGGESPGPEPHTGRVAAECGRTGSAVFTDLHRHEPEGAIHLGIFVPVRTPAASGLRWCGVIYLELDPTRFLFPLLQSWPTPSPSGETLIVRREGDGVLFLNDLRHRTGTALKLWFPVTTTTLPAAVAVQGTETVLEGIDYRGAPVLAATRSVPGSPWFMVAKVDRAELEEGIRGRGRLVSGIAAALLLLSASSVGLVWRQQRIRFYRGQLEAERRVVDERERRTAELAAGEQRFRRTLDGMLEGCQIIGADWRYLYVNDAAARHGRRAKEELLGRTMMEVYPGIEETELFAVLRRCRESSIPRTMENEFVYPDGSTGWFELSIQPTAEGIFVLSIDTTERKRAAAELERRLADLARSNEELQRFAHIASHDLQEPLRMIASFLQLIERRYGERLDQDGREFIAFAVGGAQRLQLMIDGLRQYSRVERRQAPFAPTDSGQVLDRALRNLRTALEESGAVVTRDRLPTLPGDEALLEQLFQSLLANAIEFRGTDPPRIHVSCAKDGAAWLFSVRDNGIGIEERHRGRIFSVFERLNPREHAGAGIGLALCRRIVERHGGRIRVEPAPGGGSVFLFSIPCQGANG